MTKKEKSIKDAVGKMILALSAALDKHGHLWSAKERSATNRVMRILSLP